MTAPDTCALWVVDLDGDDRFEAVLLTEQRGAVHGVVYARSAQAWRREGALRGSSRPLSIWMREIEERRVLTARPRWPDLTVDGERLAIVP